MIVVAHFHTNYVQNFTFAAYSNDCKLASGRQLQLWVGYVYNIHLSLYIDEL